MQALCTYQVDKMVASGAYNPDGLGSRLWESYQSTSGINNSLSAPLWATGGSDRFMVRGTGAALVDAGEKCPATTSGVAVKFVLLEASEYNAMASHTQVVSPEDVAALIGPVMLVWSVAWLCKRAIRVLIPNA